MGPFTARQLLHPSRLEGGECLLRFPHEAAGLIQVGGGGAGLGGRGPVQVPQGQSGRLWLRHARVQD